MDCSRPHDVEDARTLVYLPSRVDNRARKQSKRKKCVAVNKDEKNWKYKDAFIADMEMQSLEFALLCFGLVLLPSLHFGIVL